MTNHIIAAVFISILLVVGVGAGHWYAVWEDVFKEKDTLLGKIKTLEGEIDKLKDVDKDLERYKAKIEELKEKKKKLQTDSIRLDDVVPTLLESTETVASKFDIKFQDIRISPLVRAEDWSELPVEIIIQGTFRNVYCFLKVMENRKIINLAAGSMNVAVSNEIDKDSNSPMLSVTLSAKVYIL